MSVSSPTARQSSGFMPRTSLRERITRPTVLLISLGLATFSLLAFLTARSLMLTRTLSHLSTVATLQEDAIERAVALDREEAARQLSADAQSDAAALWRNIAERRPSAAGVTIFDAAGQITASAGERSPVPLGTVTTTALIPTIDRKNGWIAHDVYVPLRGGGVAAVRFDAHAILERAFSPALLSEGGSVTLVREQEGEYVVVQRSADGEPLRTLPLGTIDDPFIHNLPVARAARGEEGTEFAWSEDGTRVLVAFRSLPTLGWGMTVEMDAALVLGGVMRLGLALFAISFLLIALAIVVTHAVARHVTDPLMNLAASVSVLGPGRWEFRSSVRTGDEVEMLDRVIDDLAWRLRIAYESLEGKMRVTAEGLRRESALDAVILDSIEYGVIVTDTGGAVTEINPSAVRMLGTTREQVLGGNAATVFTLIRKKNDGGKTEHPVALALRGEQFHSRSADHLRVLRADKTFLPVSLIASPLLTDNRQFGAVMVFQDMTEERQIDYMKSEFISLASHQLRTPLSSIRWYAEMLTTGGTTGLSEDQQTYVKEIFDSSVRMANLIEALLHVARIESGVLVPERKTIDLAQFLRQTGGDWDGMAREKKITIIPRVPQNPVMVFTDPILLQIIMQNLLGNALKYSEAGSQVTIALEKTDNDVLISVSDQGIGILPEDAKRLFQKFFRGHNARNIDTDGNGLGLYISRSIATTLGGQCDFYSRPGKGTTFRLRLPAV